MYEEKVLLNVKEMSEYLNICETMCRRLLSDRENHFLVRIGNRVYAHKKYLDRWLETQIM